MLERTAPPPRFGETAVVAGTDRASHAPKPSFQIVIADFTLHSLAFRPMLLFQRITYVQLWSALLCQHPLSGIPCLMSLLLSVHLNIFCSSDEQRLEFNGLCWALRFPEFHSARQFNATSNTQSMQHIYNTMVSSKLNKVTDESSLQMSVLPSPTSCAHHQSKILREKLPIINLSSSEK